MSRNDVLNQRLDRITERREQHAALLRDDRARVSHIDGKGQPPASGWVISAVFLLFLLLFAFGPALLNGRLF